MLAFYFIYILLRIYTTSYTYIASSPNEFRHRTSLRASSHISARCPKLESLSIPTIVPTLTDLRVALRIRQESLSLHKIAPVHIYHFWSWCCQAMRMPLPQRSFFVKINRVDSAFSYGIIYVGFLVWNTK